MLTLVTYSPMSSSRESLQGNLWRCISRSSSQIELYIFFMSRRAANLPFLNLSKTARMGWGTSGPFSRRSFILLPLNCWLLFDKMRMDVISGVGVWRHQVANIPHWSSPMVNTLLGKFLGCSSCHHFMDLGLVDDVPLRIFAEPFLRPQKGSLNSTPVIGKRESSFQGYFESKCGASLWASALTSFSSFTVIPFPLGWQLPHRHPLRLAGSSNTVPFPPFKELSTLNCGFSLPLSSLDFFILGHCSSHRTSEMGFRPPCCHIPLLNKVWMSSFHCFPK